MVLGLVGKTDGWDRLEEEGEMLATSFSSCDWYAPPALRAYYQYEEFSSGRHRSGPSFRGAAIPGGKPVNKK